MKLNRIILFLGVTLSIAAVACGRGSLSAESIEESLREAEDAIAAGDMVSAQSAASYLFDDSATCRKLTATQLARLSMVYVMLADSVDQETNTNRAADLYDLSLKTNADSAREFYQSVNPEHLQYVETMSNHSANRAHPVDISNLPDESEEEIHSLNDI